jgi:hypothetical protein
MSAMSSPRVDLVTERGSVEVLVLARRAVDMVNYAELMRGVEAFGRSQ